MRFTAPRQAWNERGSHAARPDIETARAVSQQTIDKLRGGIMGRSVRFGVIGVGSMGRLHCRMLGEQPEACLTAVCDANRAGADAAAEEFKVKAFYDYKTLINSGLCDAVIVATPHYQHPPIGIYAMNKGLHLLCEKPIAVSPQEADRLMAAARRAARRGIKFGVMFQWRTNPAHRKAREIVQSGALGEIYRTQLLFGCLRTQAYYNSGAWRGTWAGEGGGVLLNQAPHPLDLFTWLGGMPSKVSAWTRTRKHQIEVEDDVHALVEYPNGAAGYLYCSVNEFPEVTAIAICGEKGKLELSYGKVSVQLVSPPVDEYIRTTDLTWGKLEVKRPRIKVEPAAEGHGAVIADFVSAIVRGTPLLCPGEEGMHSLELANGIIQSGKTGRPVSFPLDRDAYETFLGRLRQKSNNARLTKS